MKSVCRSLFLCVGILGFPFFIKAQTSSAVREAREKIEQLRQNKNYRQDTNYANALADLAYIYTSEKPDTAVRLLETGIGIYREAGNRKGEANAYIMMGDAFKTKGQYDKAMQNYETAFRIAEEADHRKALPLILNRIGTLRLNQGNYPEALRKFYASRKAAENIHNSTLLAATINNIAIVHFYQNQFAEAEHDYRELLTIAQQLKDTSRLSLAYNGLGEIDLQEKHYAQALQNLSTAYRFAAKMNDPEMMSAITLTTAEVYYEADSLAKAVLLFEKGMQLAKQTDNGVSVCNALIGLARTQRKQGLLKEALANALDGLQRANRMGQVQLMRDANEVVSDIYEALGKGSQALLHYKSYKIYADSLNNLASERAAATEKAKYEFSKKEDAFERRALQQQWILIFTLTALLLLAIILWQINRNRKRLNRTNKELEKKNELIEVQKRKAEEALIKLKETQTQLIQSDKMASLGELTAGIAHEIQNPLNFVNNFSEVSNELIDEWLIETSKERGERDEVMEEEIVRDLRQNLEKINHHGKRADSIVKRMLQHSRKNTGQKEATDINALCDEYLRLSYHGLRAKDKSFQSDFTTDFDTNIGSVSIDRQDIGRVLLNLFNNAFYAVKSAQLLQGNQYKPLVTVTTKRINVANNEKVTSSSLGAGGIEIIVSDNGSGIPQSVIHKIFQPFFTTKPTGEGTGLGLSMSYDIITKEHNGSIRVESEENVYTRFIITLSA